MMFDPCTDGRPEWWEMDFDHPYADGLRFFAGGRHPGSNYYDDASLYGNHGLLTNMDPATDWVWDDYLGRWVTDHITDDYIYRPSPVVSATPITMTAWFEPANNNTIYTLCGCANSGTDDGFLLELSRGTAGRVAANTWRAGMANAVTSTAYSANVWQHACAVFVSPTNRRVYLNGASEGINATSMTPGTLNNTTIGCNCLNGIGRYMSGMIGDVLIWNRVLSASEIAREADPAWSVMMGGLILPPRRRSFPSAAAGGASTIELPAMALTI